ncbi:MAG: cytochrome c maturation protein CcmE [Planctomycetota bacterium]|jgi:cytochrome c-type biogenesis protein CcmE
MKTKTIVKTLIGLLVIGGGMGYFIYQAMQNSWSYYYSVDDFAAAQSEAQNYSLRIAGKVKPGSISRDLEKMNLAFTLAGAEAELPVHYKGSVPDNFDEDREVVVSGSIDLTGIFQADTLMTRCESKYKAKVN